MVAKKTANLKRMDFSNRMNLRVSQPLNILGVISKALRCWLFQIFSKISAIPLFHSNHMIIKHKNNITRKTQSTHTDLLWSVTTTVTVSNRVFINSKFLLLLLSRSLFISVLSTWDKILIPPIILKMFWVFSAKRKNEKNSEPNLGQP